MNAWQVRKLRRIAEARWELRKWRLLTTPGRRQAFTADIDEITRTGELPRVKREDS